MKSIHKRSEHIVSVCLLGICALWLIYSRNISGATMPGTPGPKFFPFIIVALLAFLTILKEILDWRRMSDPENKNAGTAATEVPGTGLQSQATKKDDEPNDADTKGELRRVVLSFVLIFLYVVGIEVIGFYVATILAVCISLKGIIGIPGWLKVSMVTLIITGAVFLIFWVLFKVPLPQGILF
jgi:hypothetical protein